MDKYSNKKTNTKAKETWKKIGKGALKVLIVAAPKLITAATDALTEKVADSKSKKIEHQDNE